MYRNTSEAPYRLLNFLMRVLKQILSTFLQKSGRCLLNNMNTERNSSNNFQNCLALTHFWERTLENGCIILAKKINFWQKEECGFLNPIQYTFFQVPSSPTLSPFSSHYFFENSLRTVGNQKNCSVNDRNMHFSIVTKNIMANACDFEMKINTLVLWCNSFCDTANEF